MKLFLASEAKHETSFNALEHLVGGFQGKSIAYIPTAANGERPFGTWQTESSTWKLVQTLGAKVTSVVLEDYKDISVKKVLQEKDILWFAGGACGYLMYWIRRCGIDRFLPQLLEKGSLYVGSSAGSMITAKSLEITELYIGEVEQGAGVIPGLGLVNFTIYPHFQEEQYAQIKAIWGKDKMYLLKDGQAIIVDGQQIQTVGDVKILNDD